MKHGGRTIQRANPDRVSADEIRPILNNVGRKLEIEKRLSALEKRYVFFCFLAY